MTKPIDLDYAYEGVLVLDPNYVQARNVYVQLALSFRFGREEDESMGYNFVKTMHLSTSQLYPPVKDITTSEIQRNLISKLGNFAFPFVLEFPELASPTYSMMQGWEDSNTLMGVEYEVMGFVGNNIHDMQTRSISKLMIRRLMECPTRVWDVTPSEGTLTRTFLTCSGTVNLEASLNSHVFFPEEDIIVKVSIRNYSSREIKRIKVKLVQLSEVPMFNDNQIRDKTVSKIDDPLNLGPGACTNRQFTLVPAVPSRQAQGQIFLQSTLHTDGQETLAPTTILNPKVNKRDLFGVHVSYAIRVKVTLGTLIGDAILDVPFVLAVQQGVSMAGKVGSFSHGRVG
ncbi:hypothetical protein Pcinc_003617 [Petrolisthes cinctipes]|uniref:Arrestin C-terminal-like domain-containing protein n=1 Tax=Petrolisthes cinctipes TaxID=88211 RepID=A0AAE1GIL3_PETCI|nr:hypothetical protein Pcinc_003617 [Petrolisthes cinctipes]